MTTSLSAVPMPQESIAAEIEALRAQFPDTQALYREACALLFFRHGITPTANKLYQLVRRGSMSAPAEALSKFWETLREKSRVRIEHPDLPPELAESAGALIASLWQRAREQAGELHAAERAESHAATAAAESQAQEAQRRADEAAQALFALQAEFSASLTRYQELEQALAHERGVCKTLESQLQAADRQQRELREALHGARQEAVQLRESKQSALASQDERHREELFRVGQLAESDRAAAAAAHAALSQLREQAQALEITHAAQIEALRSEASAAQAALAIAEARLTEARLGRDLARRQLDRATMAGKSGTARRGRIVRTG